MRINCVVLVCLFGLLGLAQAQEPRPYVSVWGLRGQSMIQEVKQIDEPLGWSSHQYWGAEVLGRVPVRGPWSILGRVSTEGHSGKYVFQDFKTWTRGLAEGAVAYRVSGQSRYTCSVLAGAGVSAAFADGDREPVNGMPPKYGVGAHCRDDKLRMWAQARAVWDEAAGGGAHLEALVHAPLYGERAGLGVLLSVPLSGGMARVELQAKARVWQR